jgi:hypothetical protein
MLMDTRDETTVDALTLLPLPTMLHLLTGEQLRGADCVWCYGRLNSETAFDLGAHSGTIKGVEDSTWFPRGCPACVAHKARTAIRDHSESCEQCADDPVRCTAPDLLALRELTVTAVR